MISWVAMDRIVERKRATDAAYRQQGVDKVLRCDAKRLTDGDLLAKLRSGRFKTTDKLIASLRADSVMRGNNPKK